MQKSDTDFYDGLVISGGARKIMAAMGVLKNYKEELCKITHFAGTSSGSVLAALIAAGYNADELFLHMTTDLDPFINIKFGDLSGLLSLDDFMNSIEKLLRIKGIENMGDYRTKDKFLAVCCTNLNSIEHKIYITTYSHPHLPVKEVLRASCSIPIIFKPVFLDGMLLCDGGIVDNIPILSIRNFCSSILAIKLKEDEKDIKPNIFSVGIKSMKILLSEFTKQTIEISPPEKLIEVITPQDYTLESLYMLGTKYK